MNIDPLPSTNLVRIIYQQFIYEASLLRVKWHSIGINRSNGNFVDERVINLKQV